MIDMSELNIPITLDCNLRCKYCFRDSFERPERLPDLSDDMITFLKTRTRGRVTLSGGEPLTHFDKVQEIFSYVPDTVFKSIITNGTLLTSEIVEYVNKNNIEVLLSHDGVGTKFLRGVDVLEDESKRKLIHDIKNFRVSSVATKYNEDVWANYFYIAKKIGRADFAYFSGPLMDTEHTRYLIEGFDYDTYINTLFQFILSRYRTGGKKRRVNKCIGFSVLLDGTICGNINVSAKYGTIFDNFADCKDKAVKMGDIDFCVKSGCKHNAYCRFLPQGATEHSCKCRRMILDREHSLDYIKETSEYVKNHMDEIEKKYGWDSKYLV